MNFRETLYLSVGTTFTIMISLKIDVITTITSKLNAKMLLKTVITSSQINTDKTIKNLLIKSNTKIKT